MHAILATGVNLFPYEPAKQPAVNVTDRRSADRFPIEREVRYRMLSKRNGQQEGIGKTINISSTGVLFTTDQALMPGKRLELFISWPAQLDNKCQLQLVARGRIARLENGRAAIEIDQYEFRTQRSKSLSGIGTALSPLFPKAV